MSAAELRATPRTGIAIFWGQELDYEVVDGLAVHGGDMVLGTVEEVQAAYASTRPAKNPPRDWPPRRKLSTVGADNLWPNATVPYEIDPGFSENGLATIGEAINEWNTKTVVTLVERTTQDDFIRFHPEGGGCRANVGRIGGEQSIWLNGPDGCSLGSTVHEIGHGVGLWHEHERKDRDAYVSITDARLYGGSASQYTSTRPLDGPYDFASTMHYAGLETIPPGMRVPSDRLSPGDVVGVARLYGMPVATTTISTNPPGLEINVDGEPVTTPATFNWSPGSEHVVEASSPQIVGATRLLFGRWSDGGLQRHKVTADPENPWFEASYVVQRALRACAEPAAAGAASILPESADGYYTIRSSVEIKALAPSGSSRGFTEWSVRNPLPFWSDTWGFVPSLSSNPITVSIREERLRRSEYKALFGTRPLFRIDSNVHGTKILVNGDSRRLPWAFPASRHLSGITVALPEEANSFGGVVRYRTASWSDGGASTHDVEVPAAGGSLSVEFAPEYLLRRSVRNRGNEVDAISVSPPSDDGFYAGGTQVQVRAALSQEEHFAGWVGEASGHDPVQTVVLDAPKSMEAVITKSQPLRPGEDRDLVLSASRRFETYAYEKGWNVLVPHDAAELTVEFRSSSPANVELYVNRGREVRSSTFSDGRKPRIGADFESTATGAGKTVTISRKSMPRLAHDVYFIALVVPPTTSPIRGTLSVAISRSGIVKAWPAAFTFVGTGAAAVAPQAARLTQAASPIRYRVESSQPWISATPSEWVQTGRGLTELSVAVNGAGLLPGMHRGAVTIAQVQAPDTATGGTPTGIEFPVAFTILSHNDEASRKVNGVRITSSPEKGNTYGIGDPIEAWVDFVAPVRITGKPTLALRIGSQLRQVEWDSMQSSSLCEEGIFSLGFRYTVEAEDQDADGVSVGENALGLNGGRIDTILGTPAILPLAPIPNHPEHKVDGGKVTVPEVRGMRIRSRPRDGVSYGAGEGIEAQISFSRGVEVTGSPTLALGIGAGTQLASLVSQGDRILVFRYTVQAGDSDTDGISVPTSALALNGGTIRSSAGADAALDLGSHAIADDPEHKVDGSKVVAPEVTGVRITSRPQDGIAYASGEEIEARISFSSEVEVRGSPTLAFSVGTVIRQARLARNEDRALYFRYPVQSGDTDADGISILAGALVLNGGSIRDDAGADAALDLGSHVIANDSEHKVDGSKVIAPQVRGVRITSRPQDGVAYGAGEEILAYVQFSQDVEVTGDPTLALTVGTATRHAAISLNSGRYVWFGYTVQGGDTDSDGISILAGALALNGASILNAAGADASLDLGTQAITDHPGHKVDGGKVVAPEASGVRITSRPQDGVAYGAGEQIRAYVQFSQTVEVTGNPLLALTVGAASRLASVSSNNGRYVRFLYTVQTGDSDMDGISILADALTLNGGRIRGAAGLDATLDLGSHAIADHLQHKVDGSKAVGPAVSSVRITGRPNDGQAYGTGEEIAVQVIFNQTIEVAGNPTLAIRVGTVTRIASIAIVGSRTLFFRYLVHGEDSDTDGISILADALALNGGRIRSVAGLDATLDLGSHAIANQLDHKVDGSKVVGPAVSSVRIASRPHDRIAYTRGAEIVVQVRFSQPIEMTGSPTLAITIGTVTRLVPVAFAGSRTLHFRYLVQADDSDTDGISILADALALNAGTLRGLSGMDAALDLGSHIIGNDPAHKVYGAKVVAAAVVGVRITSRPLDGMAYGVSEDINLRVEFSHGVEVTGTPILNLSMGTGTRVARYRGRSGTTVLHFRYTVQIGDADTDGISVPVDALEFNASGIRSVAGPDAVLDLGSHAIVNDPGHKVSGE